MREILKDEGEGFAAPAPDEITQVKKPSEKGEENDEECRSEEESWRL